MTKVKDAADQGLDHITISEVNGDQKFLLKVNTLLKTNKLLFVKLKYFNFVKIFAYKKSLFK